MASGAGGCWMRSCGGFGRGLQHSSISRSSLRRTVAGRAIVVGVLTLVVMTVVCERGAVRKRRRACGRVQRGCGDDTGNGVWGLSMWRVGTVAGPVAEAGWSPWWVIAVPVLGNGGVRRALGGGTGNGVCGRVQYGCGVDDTGNGVCVGDGCHRVRGGTYRFRIWSGNGGVCE